MFAATLDLEVFMLRSSLLPAAVLISALLLGCGEQPASFMPTGNPLASRTADNPDGPGALVIHFRGTGAGFGNCDEGADICYFLGFSLEEWVQGCAEELPAPSGEGLRIEHFRPDGSLHVLDHSKTEPLLVWGGADPADLCTSQPFAIGTGQFIGRDNDVTFSGNRANSFAFRVQGTVTAIVDEQRYRLTNTFHATADRNGDLKVDRYEFEINPIGR